MDGYVKITFPFLGVRVMAVVVALAHLVRNAIRATENIHPARLGDPQ